MIVTIFRNRLRPDHADEWSKLATELGAEAASIPGYVSRKVFTAEDGERVTIVEFDSEASHRAWAEHPKHRAAQNLGREKFYAEYILQVCETRRESRFKMP